MKAHQERAAGHGDAQLRQDHPEEDPPGAEPQRGGGLFDRRVQAAERCGRRNVHEREVGEGGDQDAGAEPLQRRDGRNPGVAVHKRGDGQRRRQQHGPDLVAAQLGAFHQPGAADTQDKAQRHSHQHQQHGVKQELADAWPEDQSDGGVPPGHCRHVDDVAQRNEGKQCDQHRQDGHDGNAERRAGAFAPARRRRAPRGRGSR